MPQGRKTAEEVLGLPPRRPTAEEVLGLQPARPTAEQVLGLAPQQPPQNESYYRQLKRNVGLGFEMLQQKLANVMATGYEIGSGLVHRDTRPLKETAERAYRAAVPIVGALASGPSNAGQAYVGLSIRQAPAVEAVKQRQAQRREAAGDIYFRGSAIEHARQEAEAAKDPSLLGKIERGLPQALPYVAIGAATGGSVPAMMATGAVMELSEPENIPLAVGLGALPIGGGARAAKSAVAPAVERVLGRGAAQIVEAEAAQAPRALGEAAQMAFPGMERAIVSEATQPALTGLEDAIGQAVKAVPPSRLKQAAGELSAFPRSMMSSLDISAPGRQGLLLSVAPSRWGAAIKAGARMFRAFKPEAYERITQEIIKHPDAGLAERSGLFLALRRTEEFFTSKLASKIPGVQASQRAYETYLDSLRMSTFSQYKRIILKSGLDEPGTLKALEAAAKWINIATGRGSLGKRFDDAVPLLSQFLFAPRYTASRIQILNPAMYARNFANPATRVVAKQQMKDLAQYLGAVATTFALAKAAGLDVGLNPAKGDFLKIRAGSKTYDPGAGLTQLLRFGIRASYDLFRASKGEKAPYGQDAASLTERFIRSKLAPVPSYAWDFFARQTYEGKDFNKFKGVYERVTPLMWQDFSEALYNEGLGSAAATLPGAVGIGVQNYTKPGGALDRMQPLFSEYVRAGRSVPEIRRLKDEGDEQFNARVKVFGEALESYGLGLVGSDEYRQADAATKTRALDLLPRRIGSALMREGEAWQLAPRVLIFDAKGQQRQREPRRLYGVGGERLQ